MKTVYRYVCEICNTVYNTEEECRLCEEYHATPISMEVCDSVYRAVDIYPRTILVKMDNGNTIPYYSNR